MKAFPVLLFISAFTGVTLAWLPDAWELGKAGALTEIITTFSYFTIWSNSLVALMAFSQLLPNGQKLKRLFASANVQTCIAVYIFATGLIYQLLLSQQFTGVAYISDVLLHAVTPVLFVIYWFFAVRTQAVSAAVVWQVLLLPILFSAYWLVRGAVIGSYPYYFMDVTVLSQTQLMVNFVVMLVAASVVAALLWLLSRFSAR